MAEVFLSVQGIDASTTPSEIDEILSQSKIAYSKLVNHLHAKVTELREDGLVEQEEI